MQPQCIIFLLVLVLSSCVAVRAGDVVFSASFRGAGSLSGWSNVVPEHASLITPGYTSGSYALKITSTINNGWLIHQSLVNIKQWAGCKVLLSSTLKAFNVTRPSESYLGIKTMLYQSSPSEGLHYSNKGNVYGTFGWSSSADNTNVTIYPDVTDGTITLGIQGATGVVYFDSVTITVVAVPSQNTPAPTAKPTPAPTSGPVTLSVRNVYSNNMVLQRNKQNCFWGRANVNEVITITLVTADASVPPANRQFSFHNTTSSTASWSVCVPTSVFAAFRYAPFNVQIKGATATITLTNLLFGEVWLCSGQSNMQYQLGSTFDARVYETETKNSSLRLYKTVVAYSTIPSDNTKGPNDWAPATRSFADYAGFSAVCYVYGREVLRRTGVPVGLIDSAEGSTAVQAWTSKEGYAACSTKYPFSGTGTNTPMGLWNQMIHPFRTLSLAGFLWYQGESNVGSVLAHSCYFPNMITSWRSYFNAPNALFGFVQLSAVNTTNTAVYNSYDVFRWSQAQSTKSLPNVYHTTGIDLGDLYTNPTVHSRNKTLISLRLYRQIGHALYGESATPVVGPNPTSCCNTIQTATSTQTFKLRFGNATSLQQIPTPYCWSCCDHGPFDLIAAATPDVFNTRHQFNASSVSFSANEATFKFDMRKLTSGYKVVEVRHAARDYPQCVLYNPQLLPAFSFNISCSATC